MEQNAFGWVEIPVIKMKRAIAFYSSVFGFDLKVQDLGNVRMAFFPYNRSVYGAGGALVKYNPCSTPIKDGACGCSCSADIAPEPCDCGTEKEKFVTIAYFNSPSGDLANELAKVVAAKGKIIMPKTAIGEDNGFMAWICDTEGNKIALHSLK